MTKKINLAAIKKKLGITIDEKLKAKTNSDGERRVFPPCKKTYPENKKSCWL